MLNKRVTYDVLFSYNICNILLTVTIYILYIHTLCMYIVLKCHCLLVICLNWHVCLMFIQSFSTSLQIKYNFICIWIRTNRPVFIIVLRQTNLCHPAEESNVCFSVKYCAKLYCSQFCQIDFTEGPGHKLVSNNPARDRNCNREFKVSNLLNAQNYFISLIELLLDGQAKKKKKKLL